MADDVNMLYSFFATKTYVLIETIVLYERRQTMMISVRRFLLGVEYQEIAKELATYDMILRFAWTREQKERVVELLEREAEMDIELAEYLIKDGDELGIRQLNINKALNAKALWDLKMELSA